MGGGAFLSREMCNTAMTKLKLWACWFLALAAALLLGGLAWWRGSAPKAAANRPPAAAEPFQDCSGGDCQPDISALLRMTLGAASGPLPSGEGTEGGPASAATLQELLRRVQAEAARLTAAGPSATTVARIDTLHQVAAEVQELISQLMTGSLAPAEVPIAAADAQAFLQDLSGGVLRPLVRSGGSGAEPAPLGTGASPFASVPAALAEAAPFVQWSLNVSYDPELRQRDKALDRLAAATEALNKVRAQGQRADPVALRAATLQVQALQRAAAVPAAASGSSSDDAVEGRGWGGTGGGAPTYWTDDMLRFRASAASTPADAAAGLTPEEYKERVKRACRFVQGAGLGDPANFGCPAVWDEATLGATYSWKGAYAMVCSRLGGTWGGGYPAMAGCIGGT